MMCLPFLTSPEVSAEVNLYSQVPFHPLPTHCLCSDPLPIMNMSAEDNEVSLSPSLTKYLPPKASLFSNPSFPRLCMCSSPPPAWCWMSCMALGWTWWRESHLATTLLPPPWRVTRHHLPPPQTPATLTTVLPAGEHPLLLEK